MNVHIVAEEYQLDRILGRLARALAEGAGWTVSEQPNPNADINYLFPYLELKRVGKPDTRTAAWFSHKDLGQPGKVRLWEQAANQVDLRLTSAKLYLPELTSYGDAALVTPPLERDKFAPVVRNRNPKPIVGVSGWVYQGGRKGEALVAELMRSPLAKNITLLASGKGWPVSTKHYEWSQQQQFFQQLDVYLCTSSIEGIGYPVLEALACGVPVVVPRGVGVFDELPDLENLHRYTANNYTSMETALGEALGKVAEGAVNVESLRGATARYTLEAWVESHKQAFEELLYGAAPVETLQPWQGRAGIFYVAYGEPARECAVRAITSAKRYLPDVPVALVSDAPLGAGEDIYIEHKDEDIGGRSVKTQIYDLAPAEWDYVLYLDADTEIVSSDVRFFFDLLVDGWELVFCINPAAYVLAREMRRPDNQEELKETFQQIGTDEILQLNGGVFAFRRNKRTATLIRAWHSEWQRYGARDQAALDRALYAQPVRLYVLGNEWNTVTRYLPAERTAGILHYPMTARRWKGRIEGRLDSSEAWAAVHPTHRRRNETA